MSGLAHSLPVAIISSAFVGQIAGAKGCSLSRQGPLMPRMTDRLTALKVARAIGKHGMYADGGGLYLQVSNGSASWIYRYMLNGVAREMGLGPLALYGLKQARAKALDARRLRHEGVDPIDARRAARAKAKLDAAKAVTFKQCAESYIKGHRAGWRK